MAFGFPDVSVPVTSSSGRLEVKPYSLWHITWVADGSGETSLVTSSKATPFQGVSNFDHLVTQWMSTTTSVDGSASTSSHDKVRSCSTKPKMRRSHDDRSGYSGTLPAWRTGNRSVKY